MSMWSLTIVVQNPKDQPETHFAAAQPLIESLRMILLDTPRLVGPDCPVADASFPGAGSLRSALEQQIPFALVFSTSWRYGRFGTRAATRNRVGVCIGRIPI